MNRIAAVFLPGCLAAGLIAGCASPQFSRIDRNREIYETWPIETRQAVLDGKVEAGMTPDMVRVSWGEPTEVSKSGMGEEVWIYSSGGDDGIVMNGTGGSALGSSNGLSTGTGGTGVSLSRGSPVVVGSSGANSGIGTTGTVTGTSPLVPPIYIPPTPAEIREVVFRDGVVFRADRP